MRFSLHSAVFLIVCAAFAMAGCSNHASDAANAKQITNPNGQALAATRNYVDIKPLTAAEALRNTQQEVLAGDLNRTMALVKGKWGVAVKEVGVPGISKAGENTPMAQQSVSKLWVAVAVMDKVEKGEVNIVDLVTLTKQNRAVFHQPLARKLSNGPIQTNVGELLFQSITQSDNMANQALLDIAGGPDNVRAVLAAHQVDIRFGPGDRAMQAAISGLIWDPLYSDRQAFERARQTIPANIRQERFDLYAANPVDGSTPEAMVVALEKIQLGFLPGSSQILAAMAQTKTGRSRLKAGTPAGWILSHKTGTGQTWGGATAGFNDVGILQAPDGRKFAVAVLIGKGRSPQTVMQRAIAEIASNVAQYHLRTSREQIQWNN